MDAAAKRDRFGTESWLLPRTAKDSVQALLALLRPPFHLGAVGEERPVVVDHFEWRRDPHTHA